MGEVTLSADNAKAPLVPFRKATVRKRGLLSTYGLPAALAGRNSWELDSKGYIAGARLLWSGDEVTSTADPTAVADYPYAIANRIELRDSSGGMVASLKGYSAEVARRFFQPYAGRDLSAASDTRIYDVDINLVATNAQRFSHEIAVEAGTKDNLGVLPNQNAAFKYTLDLTLAAETDIVTTAANAAWSAMQVQPSYRYYTVPAATRADGARQQTVPPFAGIVRQQWDENKDVPSANVVQRIALTPGKVIRNLALVLRTDGTNTPRQASISRVTMKYGDDTVLFDATEQDLIEECFRIYGAVPPTGVYPIPFTADNDGFVGADFRRDLLDTRRLSQIWLDVTFTNTGQVDIIHDELIVPANMSI